MYLLLVPVVVGGLMFSQPSIICIVAIVNIGGRVGTSTVPLLHCLYALMLMQKWGFFVLLETPPLAHAQ